MGFSLHWGVWFGCVELLPALSCTLNRRSPIPSLSDMPVILRKDHLKPVPDPVVGDTYSRSSQGGTSLQGLGCVYLLNRSGLTTQTFEGVTVHLFAEILRGGDMWITVSRACRSPASLPADIRVRTTEDDSPRSGYRIKRSEWEGCIAPQPTGQHTALA